MNRFLFPCLAIIASMLIAVTVWLWVDSDGHLKNTKWTHPDAVRLDVYGEITHLPAPTSVSSAEFLTVTERPLFSRTRRPPAPPPPPPPPPVPVAPDIFSGAVLKGVVTYQGGSGVILEMSGKSRRVKVGESLDGWKLLRVDGSIAVFGSGDSQRSIQLTRQAALKSGGSNVNSANALSPPPVPQPVSSSPIPVVSSGEGASNPPNVKKSRFGP